MSKGPTKRRGPLSWLAERSWRWWITVSVLGPLLYALSTGPIMRLRDELRIEAVGARGRDAKLHPAIEGFVSWYVKPLNFVSQHSPEPIHDAIWWYWGLCWTVQLRPSYD